VGTEGDQPEQIVLVTDHPELADILEVLYALAEHVGATATYRSGIPLLPSRAVPGG